MTARFDVELTAGAEGDLAAIHGWIVGQGDGAAADRFLDLLLERIERLESFPLRGAVLPELEPLGMSEFRQIIAAPYRIVYRVFDQRVVITLIAHGRRDFTQLLEERLLR
ncbi:type II toxin-antitoxin system RelE/ParE family toxin [uncultured Sphingomonas sp.]|uniref:type II toxin-antitoxin system RelE/ParE family toxin n=1 Tax=uncultured Sphingomonas sp. TaxID=158754 RepID=UPI0025E2489C|nr:type II toxin-antitoxin system RelE/ParE family toxin [uncultured Sphingomonas sp.]